MSLKTLNITTLVVMLPQITSCPFLEENLTQLMVASCRLMRTPRFLYSFLIMVPRDLLLSPTNTYMPMISKIPSITWLRTINSVKWLYILKLVSLVLCSLTSEMTLKSMVSLLQMLAYLLGPLTAHLRIPSTESALVLASVIFSQLTGWKMPTSLQTWPLNLFKIKSEKWNSRQLAHQFNNSVTLASDLYQLVILRVITTWAALAFSKRYLISSNWRLPRTRRLKRNPIATSTLVMLSWITYTPRLPRMETKILTLLSKLNLTTEWELITFSTPSSRLKTLLRLLSQASTTALDLWWPLLRKTAVVSMTTLSNTCVIFPIIVRLPPLRKSTLLLRRLFLCASNDNDHFECVPKTELY